MIVALFMAYALVGIGAGMAFEDGSDPSKYPRRSIVLAATAFGLLWPAAALWKIGYLIGEWES